MLLSCSKNCGHVLIVEHRFSPSSFCVSVFPVSIGDKKSILQFKVLKLKDWKWAPHWGASSCDHLCLLWSAPATQTDPKRNISLSWYKNIRWFKTTILKIRVRQLTNRSPHEQYVFHLIFSFLEMMLWLNLMTNVFCHQKNSDTA